MLDRRQALQGSFSLVVLSSAPWRLSTIAHAAVNTEDIFLSVSDPATRTFNIYASELTLTDQRVPKDMKTVIRADRIVLSDTVRTNGNDLIVFTRELVIAPNTLIDTKGAAADPDFIGRPPAPSGDRGLAGANGKDGGAGPAGGNVQIFAARITGHLSLDTSGRNGGAAQNGGRGGDGVIGPSGGGQGGSPAQGGLAGRPGVGGNAGGVLVRYLKTEPEPKVMATNRGGTHGAVGRHGLPGSPGPGGPGASTQRCANVCDGDGP